ncbi:MAG: Ig-like domain-containing protein [archaeon]|nr:Ig-like domain-containing protein [archaeon]
MIKKIAFLLLLLIFAASGAFAVKSCTLVSIDPATIVTGASTTVTATFTEFANEPSGDGEISVSCSGTATYTPGSLSCDAGTSGECTFTCGTYDASGPFTLDTLKLKDTGMTDCTGSAALTVNDNTAPTTGDVNATPASPTTADTLTCNYTYTDDFDAEGTSTFKWLKDDVEEVGQTAQTLDSANTSEGEVWKCEVTPVAAAGPSPGSATTSAGVTIASSNSVPTMDSVSASPDPIKGGESVTISVTTPADADSDNLDLYCATTTGASTTNKDFCESTGNASPYTISCIGTAASDDSTKTVYCALYDATGYSTEETTTYTNDSTGPTISNRSPASGGTVSDTTPDINFEITDSGSGFAPITADINVIIIDGNIIDLGNFTITDITDGNKYSYTLPYAKDDGDTVSVYVDVNDAVENNTSSSWSFTIDTSGPSLGGVEIDDNSGYTNDSTPLINLTGVSGDPTHMALSCNGTEWKGWETYDSSITNFSITSSDYNCTDGNNRAFNVYVKLKDAGENESGTESDSSFFDDDGPGTVSNLTAEAGNHEVRLEWDGATDAVNYRIYVDGDYNKDTTSTSTTISGLTNGTEYDFKIRATDRADNTGGWSSTASATPDEGGDTTADTTDPEVSWVAPSNNATVSGIVELKVDATDDDSGMWQVKFYVDNVIIDTVTGKTGGYYVLDWNSASVSDGSRTLKALALDRAANPNSVSTTRSITVDNVDGGNDNGPTGNQGDAEDAIDAAEAAKQEIDDLVKDLENRGLTISTNTQDAIDAAQTKLDNANTQFTAENYSGAKNLANGAKTGFETALTMITSEEYSDEDYVYNAENLSALLQGVGLGTGLVDEAIGLMGHFNVQRSLEILKVIDGDKTNYVTNVKIVISNVDGNNEVKVVEFIPKDFVDDANKIFSNFTFEIIESDPIITFNIDVPGGETVEIFYGLGTELATKADADSTIENKLMEKFIVPPVLLNKNTSLDEQNLDATGSLALGAFDFMAIIYGIGIVVVIIIVGFIIVFVASHLTKGKKERPFGLHSVVGNEPLHKKVVQKVKGVMPSKTEEEKKPKWAYKG